MPERIPQRVRSTKLGESPVVLNEDFDKASIYETVRICWEITMIVWQNLWAQVGTGSTSAVCLCACEA